MENNILYVKIGYENGVYVFKNDPICSEIPEDIFVNTPFFNQENTMEELIDIILEEPEEKVVFLYNDENQKLVRELGRKLSAEFEKSVVFIADRLEQNYVYCNGSEKIYLLVCFKNLMRMEQLNYKECSEIPVLEFDLNRDYNSKYYLTMKNGYEAFVTGIYPEQVSSTLAKHIEIESVDNVRQIVGYLDINGAIFAPEFSIDLGTDYPADIIVHLHQVQENQVKFDNSNYSYYKCVCTYTQFKEWEKKGTLAKEIAYYLKIETLSDLGFFEEDLVRFKDNGMIGTVEKRLVDECRWTNHCTLKRLLRYSVQNNYVKPCLTSAQLLLELQKEPDQQLIVANKLAAGTMIMRNCKDCQMNFYCSKCACLPDSIDTKLYCKLLQKFPYVTEYLQIKQVVNFISQNSYIFKDMNEIAVSSSVHCFEYPSKKRGKPTNRFVYIFKKCSEYYFVHLLKGTLIKIEQKYVFLLEAWVLEEAIEDVINSMAVKYQMLITDAQKLVADGYDRLKKEGMIF